MTKSNYNDDPSGAIATVTIADNDLPTISIVATDATAAETLAGLPEFEGNKTATLSLAANDAYTLDSSTSATLTIADNDQADSDPGNTLATAEVTSSAVFSRNQQVSGSDRDDFYRFTVTQSGIFTANLTGLTGDADVRLIQDILQQLSTRGSGVMGLGTCQDILRISCITNYQLPKNREVNDNFA